MKWKINMKYQWLDAWNKITIDVVQKSFPSCGQIPGVLVDILTCFKEGKACSAGTDKLERLMSVDIDTVDLDILETTMDINNNHDTNEVFVNRDNEDDTEDPLA